MKFSPSIPWRLSRRQPKAAPAPAPTAAVHVDPPAPANEKASLKLGDMEGRFGHPVSRKLLSRLGIEPAERVGSYYLYLESQWPAICRAVASNAISKMSAAAAHASPNVMRERGADA